MSGDERPADVAALTEAIEPTLRYLPALRAELVAALEPHIAARVAAAEQRGRDEYAVARAEGYAAGREHRTTVDDAVETILAARVAAARAEGYAAGVRQAIAWLRADYPYGAGPQWREDGCEWIADRLSEHLMGENHG